MRSRRTAVFGLVLAALMFGPTPLASADGCDDGDLKTCPDVDTAGAYLGLTRAQVLALPKFPSDDGGALLPDRPKNAPVYQYLSLYDCPQSLPGTISEDASCAHALKDCPPDMVGPYLRIWRQTLVAGEVTEPWVTEGATCAADVAPGARPTLSMADIVQAFKRTPWSKPQVSSQPTGNTTLVNLTTFYKVDWTADGFAPGEVDTSTLLGIRVSIRPRLVGFTYTFGDGSSIGPTASSGGVYPDGDITHVYREPGSFPVRVNTTFGADFSLDGTEWNPIPATVTVPGPATDVTVREAQGVLVTR